VYSFGIFFCGNLKRSLFFSSSLFLFTLCLILSMIFIFFFFFKVAVSVFVRWSSSQDSSRSKRRLFSTHEGLFGQKSPTLSNLPRNGYDIEAHLIAQYRKQQVQVFSNLSVLYPL
jgi:hypothetical protein